VFRVELEKDDEVDAWSAVIPALSGCAVDEETPGAALEALQEAAEIFVEFLLERGEGVPIDPVTSVADYPVIAVNVGVHSLAS
jgi:predicted RNase H-like HicB family nuclease